MPATINYRGKVVLPKKIYQDDSRAISLTLHRDAEREQVYREMRPVRKDEASQDVTVQISSVGGGEQFLEVALEAVYLKIKKGEGQQKLSCTLATLPYTWLCGFEKSGNHTLLLRLKVISPSREREIRPPIEQSFRVMQYAGLTKQQLALAAVFLGVPGVVGTIAGTLLTLIQVLSPGRMALTNQPPMNACCSPAALSPEHPHSLP